MLSNVGMALLVLLQCCLQLLTESRLLGRTPFFAAAFGFNRATEQHSNRAALSCSLCITEHEHSCFYKQLPVNVAQSVSPGWNGDNNRYTLSLRTADERLNTMFIIVNLNVTAITGLGNSSRMYSMNKYSVRSTTVKVSHTLFCF